MKAEINELGFQALFHTREGQIGQHIERRARDIVQQAQVNAARIMWRRPGDVQAIKASDPDNELHVVIGVVDEGRSSRYLADKAAGLIKPKSEELFPEGWLKAALRGFGD